MRLLRKIVPGILIIVIVTTLGFFVWAETPLLAASDALSALDSDSKITVTVDDHYIAFHPTNAEPTIAFVFYPGGRVDYRAYAVPLRKIAEQGFLVVLLKVKLNLAFFDVNAADNVRPDFPNIKHWVVGGHSLGGVAAALYASKKNNLDGVVFWASYPANDSLKNTKLKVLTIYGTRDKGGVDKFDQSRALLPADAQFVIIDGGNHSQFGDYGLQPGDNAATISRADQQTQAVDATVKFLKAIGEDLSYDTRKRVRSGWARDEQVNYTRGRSS